MIYLGIYAGVSVVAFLALWACCIGGARSDTADQRRQHSVNPLGVWAIGVGRIHGGLDK